MGKLSERLIHTTIRDKVIKDCCALIEEEVQGKSGIAGLVIKGAYQAVKRIKPNIIHQAVEALLPEFAQALDPLYEEAIAQAMPVQSYFMQNQSQVTEALLAITDKRIENVSITLVKATYQKLRSGAKKHVESAIPKIGSMIERHTTS
ncbi:DUF6918 family protein [Pajaroellobacter abortibovis]|uniref:Uncharacterized protein n=1 Tax=Pajaroellobacter abortibovis TaxID=1882918 RepID=A0A1L6MZ21_9BACT|nr:hypothetical protein [Pajaroellobacter abortibovis]APS00756.1 hypothetical protein BCY86_08745 [Pajaroellobacter abortibovis]